MKKKLNISFSPPDITQDEMNSVIEVLKSGWITTGMKTKELEKKIAQYVNVNKAVCLNSATAAMELTLRMLGVGPGDEVITSAYTYTASAAVIKHVGAKIVLIDTDIDSFEMDYQKMEEAITAKTKVIIPVDIAGVICDYQKIFEIVNRKKNLFKASNDIQRHANRVIVLADAAHSFGAVRNGKISGQIADITCFSFHAVKNLTTAEGGAITWTNTFGMSDDELYNVYMLLSLHGQTKDAMSKMTKGSWEYDIALLGHKCNMTDVHAAIGLAQLARYNSLLKKRFELINLYEKHLDMERVSIIKHIGYNYRSSGHLLLINVNNMNEISKNEIILKMAENGISTNVHYKPLPMFTAYKKIGFNIRDFPNAYSKYRNEITLPLHTLLNEEEVVYICNVFNSIIKELD